MAFKVEYFSKNHDNSLARFFIFNIYTHLDDDDDDEFHITKIMQNGNQYGAIEMHTYVCQFKTG